MANSYSDAKAISLNNQLTSIVISADSWRCSEEAVNAFALSLATCDSLESVAIDIRKTGKQAITLLNIILQEAKIKSLQIRNFDSIYSSLRKIGEALQVSHTLQEITLDASTLNRDHIEEEELISLFTGIAQQRRLQCLRIAKINFSDLGLKILNDLIDSFTVRTLILTNCGITSAGSPFLASIIKKCEVLEDLGLGCSKLNKNFNIVIDNIVMLRKLNLLSLESTVR